MTKKNKIGVFIFILLIIFLFTKAQTSKKIYSSDMQYSVYAQTYVYSELLCVFSYMDCWHHGKIYLYDEKEKKVIESLFADVTESYETVNWFGNKVAFKSIDIKIPNDFWDLPRPLIKKSLNKNETNNIDPQVEEVIPKYKLSESEIYFASKRIHESFSKKDSITIEYITQFLKRDSIKVSITHALEDDVEIFYLKGDDKQDFFYNPETYNGLKIRKKSDYYNVKENCYEFNIEGISHNSIYIKKLCYVNDEKGMSLLEIHLLVGD